MSVTREAKPRGDFDKALERAAQWANRKRGGLEAAEAFLERAGWGRSFFGIEHVSVEGRELAYLNSGDTYSATVASEDNGEVFVTTWGDWLETAEQEYESENDCIRCGYCGEFTPLEDPDNWHDTVCESCGYFVDGSGKPKRRRNKTVAR